MMVSHGGYSNMDLIVNEAHALDERKQQVDTQQDSAPSDKGSA
jgi:hypothetical protein